MNSGGSRLWPVLALLVALISGTVALEIHARTRDPQAIVVQVRPEAFVTLDAEGDDEDGDEGSELEEDGAPPVSLAHARAREQARLGELDGAIATLRAEIDAHPADAALQADLGYFLLAGGRTREAIAALERARELGSASPYTLLNLGVGLRRSGELAAAEQALRAALAARPGFRAARLALSTLLRKQRRFDEAAAILRDLASTGGNAARGQALLALGKLELAAGHGKRAERVFEQAIEWLPAQPELRISAARAYLASNAPEYLERARAIAESAVALAPDLAEAHSTLARVRELAQDRGGAAAEYAAAIRLRPDYHHARRRLLKLALQRLDYAQAELHAEQLLSQAGDEPEHHFLAGLVAARAGRTEDARAHYLAAIAAAHEDYPEAFFNLGVLEKDAGRIAQAIAAYEKAIALDPKYLPALNNLGLAHASLKDYAAAEQAYQRALAADPSYVAVLVNLGKLRLRNKDAAGAVKAFEQAAAFRPRSQETLLNLGVAYRRAGRIADAEATYRKLIAAQPRYVSAFYNLGVAIEHAGRFAEARAAYERALALEPDHLLSLRRLARLCLRQNELPQASALYRSILDHEPTDSKSRVALAEIHRRQGNVQACTEAVTAAMAADAGRDPASLLPRCRSARAQDALHL